MTWKELSNIISYMTEEEQHQNVAIWGECFDLCMNCSIEKTSSDQYHDNEWGDVRADELNEKELKERNIKFVCKSGQYYILGS